MANLSEEVRAIYANETEHKVQFERLRVILNRVFQAYSNDPAQLTEHISRLVDAVLTHESSSMVTSRQFISEVATRLEPPLSHQCIKSICTMLLSILQSRALAYEEQSAQIRFRLADILEQERAYKEASQTLAGIQLESSQRFLPPDFKMNTYLRIAELCIEANNIDDAEAQINRASLLQNEVKDESLIIKYKAIYARVIDRRGKFIDAAQRYYELSMKPGLTISDKKDVLQSAVTCVVLAPPGPQRSRMLTTLVKDERCQNLNGYSILRSMYLDRLIKKEELSEFESHLSQHQKKEVDGSSVLQRSVVEHNMLAASKLYANISFESLGSLLGITPEKAERIATQMIASNRLHGSIDQLEQYLNFETDSLLGKWESEIETICEQANLVAEMIATQFPDWHLARLSLQDVSDVNVQSPANAASMQ
uniref:COP9 signalosome complex subunit 4 n=1 Tax=Acrobeloides nanus TaxID=290746 RepID=A0A914BYV8_9BILA